MESQKIHPRVFSCEYFPPKDDDARAKLRDTTHELAQLKPKYFSVTFGAGGGARDGTYHAVQEIQAQGHSTAPHISCIGSTRAELRELLAGYRTLGIDRLVALRGDQPKDGARRGDLQYANELVEFIRAETGNHFHIEVAAYPEYHPEASTPDTDLENFRRKVEAGANAALTQYFFNADAYYRFVDACAARGLGVPIVPGIMPITNYKQLARFSDACGAEIPRWIRKRLEVYGDDLESLRAFGLDVVTELCAKLLTAGAPGLHFYTMNRSGPTLEIWKRLGLKDQ